MATASASSSDDDGSERCLLLELSHDELGVIFDGLADPLEPVVAVALSSTCDGLRTPLRAGIEVLKERHARAVALCCKAHRSYAPCSCALLRDAEVLDWHIRHLTADDMATLGMVLRTNGLPRLRRMLVLHGNDFGDAGMQSLCEGLSRGAAPSLAYLDLGYNEFGPVGAEALAVALARGAMPKLEELTLDGNSIGNEGMVALAAPLRQLPALKQLFLDSCEIGDEGVASLVANLGKDDFKALETLWLDLDKSEVTSTGCGQLTSALDSGAFPCLEELVFTPKLEAERHVLKAVLERAKSRRGAGTAM